MERAVIEFRGRMEPARFAAFARLRAARLSLGLVALKADPGAMRFALTGPAALIDAFEMAVSLGPAEDLVLDVLRLDAVPAGGAA